MDLTKDEKERAARQRAFANRQAKAGGVDARREYLRMALKALDDAIEKDPDSDLLKSQRTELAGELHRLGMPSERDNLQSRLDEIEDQLANAKGLASSKMLELIATREQLITDLERFK
jgi:hypothetical protein